MPNTNDLVAAAEALGKSGGKLDAGIGDNRQPVNPAELKNMALAAGLDQDQLDLLAKDIQNYAQARQTAADAGQLKDYNLLGVMVTFDQGTFTLTPLMKTQGD